MRLQIRKVGNSLGIILPQDVVKLLEVVAGDELYAFCSEEGVQLTPFDPNFDKVMSAYERFNRQYRNALKELADERPRG